MFIKIFLFIISLSISFAQANEIIFLKKIKISGLIKTKKSVISNELDLKENHQTSLKIIEAEIKDLRNTNLFSEVKYKLVGDQEKDLLIKIQERWTTVPILKFSSGGGVGQLALGVYDPNLFGQYIEAGAQYERLEDTNSAVIWFKNPRLFGKKQGIDIQAWTTNRLRTKYEQNEELPVVKTGFLHSRKKLYLSYFNELNRSYKAHFFYEYNDDSFSDDLLADNVKVIAKNFGLPIDTKIHFIGLGLDYGKLNFDSFRVDGFLANLTTRYGVSATQQADNFWEGGLSLLYFKTLKWNLTFAQRFLSGFTSTNILQYWNYLGGLDRVRGFSDNRFAGKYYWLSNTEVRLPIFKKNWLIVQAASFVDIVSTSDKSKNIGNIDGASVGAGLRFFLPKVYRFVIRFDYAQPIKKDDDMNFSFGVQQFF